MAAKKQQQLSPENYIRQRARQLPIGICSVNKGWEEAGMADVLITREHSNGNKTLCMYIVDLCCLGIKDSLFRFNQAPMDYENFVEIVNDAGPRIEIPYPMAHNIIFAGLEYAEDLGFKPHKDFTYITQYFLEEDTDAIELIDIECGKDGKPLYVQGPHDTAARAKEIIARLEKATGPGGYDFVLDTDGEELDMEQENPYETLPFEERKQLFLEITGKQFETPGKDMIRKAALLVDTLYNDLVSTADMEAFESQWTDELEADIAYEDYTPGMLGLEESELLTEEDVALLDKIILNEEESRDSLEQLKKKWGDFAFAAYADLKYFTSEDSEAYKEKLAAAQKLYPGYALLEMEHYAYRLRNHPETVNEITFKKIFKDRKEITGYEMFNFQISKLNYFFRCNSMPALDAMCYTMNDLKDLGMQLEYVKLLNFHLLMMRIKLLEDYFSK